MHPASVICGGLILKRVDIEVLNRGGIIVAVNTKIEFFKPLNMVQFLSGFKRNSTVKAFVCFKDTAGSVKSIMYKYRERHQLDTDAQPVERLTLLKAYRTLIQIRKGIYSVRSYGQWSALDLKQRKSGELSC